ncbi:uncharacterized protein [Amphiura filiformis]|uniref:uncharacterized protein n=1 Tax=Amphiura filiformis TaxID=82378 RepID=UPI003B210ADB
MPPASKISPAKRLRDGNYAEDYYISPNFPSKLFCKSCELTIDHSRKSSLDTHLTSDKHKKAKRLKTERNRAGRRQVTLDDTQSSAELRTTITHDFIAMCTEADIPMNKTTKMIPFLRKHAKNGGAVPAGESTLRKYHLPKVYQTHHAKLLELIYEKKVFIAVDETTDERDNSVLNVIVGLEGKTYLLDTIFMTSCTAVDLAQAVTTSLTNNQIAYNDVIAFCTDNAPYCKAAYRILQPLLPNCTHVLCLAHILNLVGETFQHWQDFSDVNTLVWTMKSVFNKKPHRKRRFIAYLREQGVESPRFPPMPVQTRWNSWFEAVLYHHEHMQHYLGFFESEDTDAQSVERLKQLLTGDNYRQLEIHVAFIAESCPKMMSVLTTMETSRHPIATRVWDLLSDLESTLMNGCAKALFGEETDDLLAQLPRQERNAYMDTFHDVYTAALSKFSKHWDVHPARNIYKAARVFNPRLVNGLSRNLESFAAVGLQVTPESSDEWFAYRLFARNATPEDLNIDEDGHMDF